MSKAAKTIRVFGIYLIVAGIGFLIMPNKLLLILKLAPTTEVYIYIMAMLMFLLGFYYIAAARDEAKTLFRWSVFTRTSVLFFFIAFVLLKLTEPVLIGFGFVDLAGAIWTAIALKSDKQVKEI